MEGMLYADFHHSVYILFCSHTQRSPQPQPFGLLKVELSYLEILGPGIPYLIEKVYNNISILQVQGFKVEYAKLVDHTIGFLFSMDTIY